MVLHLNEPVSILLHASLKMLHFEELLITFNKRGQ